MKKVFLFLCISLFSIGYTQNIKNLTAKAKSGNVKAQTELGDYYWNQKNPKAAYWYEKAANQGYAEAQYKMALCYQWGLGVDKSDSKSFYWTKKAAEQGLARAQSSLGSHYDQGSGVEQSYSEAIYWYEKAAEQGDNFAYWALGTAYRWGRGVERSEEQALYWFRKACDNFFDEACNDINSIKRGDYKIKMK